MASPATVPRAAGSLLIRPLQSSPPQKKKHNSGQLGSSLPESEPPPVPSCAGAPLPAADAVTAAARPLARPSRQLPPRDVPSCARVCVSKRISSPPSLGAREGPVPAASCGVAAGPHPRGPLPTHPAPPRARPLPASPAPPPAAAPGSPRRGRHHSLEGREGRGKKRRCLPGRAGRTHRSGSLQGVGRVLGGERGGEHFYPEVAVLRLSPPSVLPRRGSRGPAAREGKEGGRRGAARHPQVD